MDLSESRVPEKRRRRRCVLLCVAATVLLIIVVAVLLIVLLRQENTFKTTFMSRCEEFKGYNCQEIWASFQTAYVNKDPCTVSPEAYDPLIAAAPFQPACGQVMLWSKTKDTAHDFTEKKNCFKTLEDTLLGTVLDGMTWCGKEGSDETFTSGCPQWGDCVDNPVRSFWNRASAAFADSACGKVTAMLNGSIDTPFHPASIFASIEVKRLKAPKVSNLDVVLVTQQNSMTNCGNPSLTDLQNALDKGITYTCREVAKSQIEDCAADPLIACANCW